MRIFLSRWWKEISLICSDWHYILLLIFSIFLFWSANSISWYLSEQNDLWNASIPVGDTMFEILPLWDLSFIFVGGAVGIVIAGAFYSIFFEPKKIPLILLAFSLLVFFRGLIISATHIGVPINHITPNTWGIEVLSFQNDLFFSGHTAGPFLAALLVWKKKTWRYFFIIISIIMAFTVLIMRLHYSIDIIGAYFITYGIFHLSKIIYTSITQKLQKILPL